jgi:hypothetical protein
MPPAGNPFQRPFPGDPFRPSSAAWRAMLELIGGDREGVENLFKTGAIEFPCLNTTGADVVRFGNLRVNAPITDFATLADEFKSRDALRGVTPQAEKPFVVFQETTKAGAIGRVRILGLMRAFVNVIDPTHAYAGPGTSAAYLVSQGPVGPARILDYETVGGSGSGSGGSGGGTGVRLAIVLVGDGGDRMRIVEEFNTGTVQPTGYIRGRERVWDVTTDTLLVGRNCLIKDLS